MSEEYTTIAGPVETELEISRSRFLTKLVRVNDEAAARAQIATVKAEHPKARHHCTAFVLGPGMLVQRSNDDGEPSGTAGAPMLDALVAAELSDVVAIVTRYFGGILLGAGGLTRAYRAAVAEATAKAARVTRALRTRVRVISDYQSAPLIEAEARRRAIMVSGSVYGAEVETEYAVAREQLQELYAIAAEISAGRAEIVPGSAEYVDL